MSLINEYLDKGIHVILDRYFYSNMAHQGGKILDKEKRFAMYDFIEKLEIDLLKLPIPEVKLFLHVPYTLSLKLKENRLEEADQHESDKNHLINAERAYLEVAQKYDFKEIECDENNEIRSIDSINDEIFKYLSSVFKK